jgi:hypothetical protein
MPNTKRVDDIIKNFAEQLQAAMREQLSEEVTMAVQAALGGSEPKGPRMTKSTVQPISVRGRIE